MAQAARSYYSPRYNGTSALKASAAPQRKERTSSRPDVHVIPGKGKENKRLKPLSAAAVSGFKIGVAVVVLLAIVCVARVWLSVEIVQSMENVTALESSIDEAIDNGKDLEIKHALLASPERIEKKAVALGMVEAKRPEHIKVNMNTFSTSSSKAAKTASKE